MLYLDVVLVFTALSSTVLPVTCSRRNTQINEIMKLLKSHLANNDHPKSSTEDTSSGDDNAHTLAEHNLNAVEFIKLLKQANKAHKNNNQPKHRATDNDLKRIIQNLQDDSNINDNDNSKYGLNKNRILAQLIKQESKPLKRKVHLIPNRLTSSNLYNYEDEDRKQADGLSQYSKIFVILDPIALKSSGHDVDLPSLLSRILKQSFSAVEKPRNQAKGHKSLILKDKTKSRRFMQQSKERDDDEDYRPKRPRAEHNGGGVGGGRTAIPYIRHRGDIYERDN